MKRFLLVLSVLAGLGLASAAWGRAGGGHSYSGSKSSSSSSSRSSSLHRSSSSSSSSRRSSSSSSSSSSSRRPSSSSSSSRGSSSYRSGSTSPSSRSSSGLGFGAVLLVLVPLGVFALVMSRWLTQGRAQSQTARELQARYQERREATQRAFVPVVPGLEALQQREPGFDAAAFLQRATRAFVDLQHAWSDGVFSDVARLMSDGVHRRFGVQVALNRFHGERNVTAEVRVTSAAIARVESAGGYDTLHVRFAAALRDATVDDDVPEAEARAVAASAPVTTFVEYWAFVRRQDPAGRAAAQEGHCPACGAPVPTLATVTCGHCQAVLNSGTHDWVLAEITQEGEFSQAAPPEVDGLEPFREADPLVDRQALEDRASLVFWKWIEAQATGATGRFARLCAPAVFGAMAGGKPTKAFEQAAVGAVDLVALRAGPDGAHAFFDVRWSTTGAGTGIVRREVLELVRQPGVKTNAKAGLSSDRCHACNAAQTEAEAVTCPFCGALLPQDWSFQALHAFEGWRAHLAKLEGAGAATVDRLADEVGLLSDPYERLRALTMMVAMARADGVVTEAEQALLRGCARRWAIEADRLEALLTAPAQALSEVVPQSPTEARGLYRSLAAAALVDGTIDREERRLLALAAEHLRLTKEETEQIQAGLRRAA